LSEFYAFCTNGSWNQYSKEELIKFTTSPSNSVTVSAYMVGL